MSDVLQRVHKIVGDMTTQAFEDGRRQERQRIIEKLDAIEGEVSWDFESQIYNLIEELKAEK